jgi:pimeloyl-ACP methyl ester carboxylesterase
MRSALHRQSQCSPSRAPVIRAEFFDLHFPDQQGYSQAKHHTGSGIVIVACDHLGVGDSTPETEQSFSLDMIAQVNVHAVGEIIRQLESGLIASDLPMLSGLKIIGAGQSMGGAILVLMQAYHRCFDAIAMLGSSAIENILPQPTAALTAAAREFFGALAGASLGHPNSVLSPPPVDHRYCFHWEDVPLALVDSDLGDGYPIRHTVPSWGSATIPRQGIEVMRRGRVASAAADITVPVLIAFGERDVAAQPHAETSAYSGSPDVSLFITPAMAHMHNFAGTRRQFWDRIARWAHEVALR